MSGTWTFTEFKKFIKMQLGQRADLESVDSENLYEIFINAAYIQLTTRNKFWGLKKKFYFPELEVVDTSLTTTAGTAYISTPSDAYIIRHLHDYSNDRKLTRIAFRKYIDYTGRTTTAARGEPTEYVRSNGYLYLYPTPDDTYTIYVYYRKIPAVLSSAATTVIGPQWDEPILQLAVVKGLYWTHQYEKADAHKKEWVEMVSSIIGAEEQEDKDKDMVMTPDQTYINYDYGNR